MKQGSFLKQEKTWQKGQFESEQINMSWVIL